MDGFAGREIEPPACDVHELRVQALQMHLDAAHDRFVERPVTKAFHLEIRRKLAIDPMQEVEIELRCHAPGIGVGSIESGLVLLQVHANQQDAARPCHLASLPQKNERFSGSEVADGGAGEKHRFPADRYARKLGQHERLRMVGADTHDIEEGKTARELA